VGAEIEYVSPSAIFVFHAQHTSIFVAGAAPAGAAAAATNAADATRRRMNREPLPRTASPF
jgi:hypothetical protein